MLLVLEAPLKSLTLKMVFELDITVEVQGMASVKSSLVGTLGLFNLQQ